MSMEWNRYLYGQVILLRACKIWPKIIISKCKFYEYKTFVLYMYNNVTRLELSSTIQRVGRAVPVTFCQSHHLVLG